MGSLLKTTTKKHSHNKKNYMNFLTNLFCDKMILNFDKWNHILRIWVYMLSF